MIIIEPIGGLCNRMRAIDAAVAYGNQIGEKVYVLWLIDNSLNCSFYKLFEKPNGINCIFQLRTGRIIGYVLSILIRKGFQLICSDFYTDSDMTAMEQKGIDYTKFHRQSKCMYLMTCSSYYIQREYPFQIFKPIKPLRSIIESYQINNQYIGIHIRRTDNERSISQSPTELFIEKMQAEVDNNPLTKFFISSDSLEEKLTLLIEFPERIVQHEQSSFNRDDEAAIQNAVIDLYLLSNCRKIIGCYWSSFTDAAWQIKGIDKEIINI